MHPNEEQVIAVMGSTGVGKSSFIHSSMPPNLRTEAEVGHSLQSETSQVQPISWIAKDGARIKLVDTPGFNDSRAEVTDTKVLKMIAEFLAKQYKGKESRLTGLIYVHRISDTRVGGITQRNPRMFQKLCGDESLKNIVIVTTMWDMVTPEDGLRREQELKSSDSPFKPLLDKGAIMRRHDRTPESALSIIEYLLGKSATQIVPELAQERDTATGTELHNEISVLLRKHEEEMESLKADMMKMWQTVQDKSRDRHNQISALVQRHAISGQRYQRADTMLNRERVITVMGSTGVGKSSFIHNSAPPGLCTVKVGHGLQSETSEAQPVCWVTQDGTTVKLVDTPGFDDSRVGMTDTQVLRMIADFLTNEYKRGKSQLTGLIYVHRISDTRVGRTSQRNLRMFRKLCGDESLKNVVIITTMWDMITLEDGLRHEQELMSNDNLFKPLLDKGAIMMRHDRTPKSATNVIDYLLGKDATTIQIVVEIVEQGKALQDTAAGTELHSEIRELMRKHREEVESMEAEMCKMQTVSTEERQEMNREMQIKLADNRKGMDQEGQREFTEERQRTEGTMAKLLMELDELKRGLTGTSDPPPVYEPGTSDFPAPETKCVVHCSKLLQLVKQYEASLARACPDVPISVASCTIHFADAVERSVTCIGHTSASLKSALTLEDMYSLQQFMRADPYPRTFTLGTWAKAQHDMKIVINDIEAILSTYRKPGFADRFRNGKGIKRSSALNAILESTKEVAADMATMVDWWSPIIDAIGNVEDAAQHEREGTGFPDSTAMASLTRIIRALDAYCEAYAKCPETLHEAAVGISL